MELFVEEGESRRVEQWRWWWVRGGGGGGGVGKQGKNRENHTPSSPQEKEVDKELGVFFLTDNA